jgi:hypothetical protein
MYGYLVGGVRVDLWVLSKNVRVNIVDGVESGDICRLLFAHVRARHACELFLAELKKTGGLTRTEFSLFGWRLQRGEVEEDFTYSRKAFYRHVRRTLLSLGLIAIEQRLVGSKDFDIVHERLKEKYVPVRQPITKRPPDGLNLARLMWVLCKRWNDEFLAQNGGETRK